MTGLHTNQVQQEEEAQFTNEEEQEEEERQDQSGEGRNWTVWISLSRAHST